MRAETALATDLLPFWMRASWDEEAGGFITHLDRAGHRQGPTDKYLVMQSRLVWTLAAAHRHGLRDQGYLELAGRGVTFLLDRMWDPVHGGFFWSVRRDGTPLDLTKRTYGHAYAIFGLAEYARAARDRTALDWATRVFDLLVARARDGSSGYRELFGRDWKPTEEFRTLDVHLHLLESLTTLAAVTGREPHRAALGELVELLVARGVHPRYRCALDQPFDRHWRLRAGRAGVLTASYGHGVELAWLLLDAVDMLAQARDRVRNTVLGLLDHALAYGFDGVRGGLARYGPPAGRVTRAWYLPAGRLVKRWWEQAECLVATLEAYRWTADARYRAAFERQFDWIWTRQMDHEAGEWFPAVSWRRGHPLDLTKGDESKCPYHPARALMRVASGLRALGVGQAPPETVRVR